MRDDPDFTPRVALEPADAPEPDDAGVDILDDTNLKKLILNFEKRVLKNQELRIKYPDLPEK